MYSATHESITIARGQRWENTDCAKNQSDCRIRYRALCEKINENLWTADKDVKMKAICAVINTIRAVVKIKSLSHLRLYPQFTHMIFIYSQSFIHHLTGLFGTNIVTSSQLACQLSWYSASPVSQRSGVQISYRPESFSGLIFTTVEVVFITAKIAFIFKTSYVKKPFTF